MKRLIIKPAWAGATRSAAPMAVSAGRLMSMPNDGRATRKLNSKVKAMEAGGTSMGRVSPWLRNRSAARANNELAIDSGVLLADMLKIAGVFRWNVTCMRLTVANRRAADRSRVLHQRRGRGRARERS